MDAVRDRAERDLDISVAAPVGQPFRASEQCLGLGCLDEERRQAGQVRSQR